MSYQPLSVREAIERINDAWYLPAIQRPYDWGERSRKEKFIRELFDSVLREYPIGTMIVWETSKEIPYRPFLDDYYSEKLGRIVDRGHWGKKDKGLVYDGQQRLQSLFSCLKFTFHGMVLCYNLLFDPTVDKGPNGFKFFEKQTELETGYIRLNEVYSCLRKQLAEFEDKVMGTLRQSKQDLSKKEELVAKNNLKQLWKLFQDKDIKLLSYYSLLQDLDEKEVVDIFTRINTTGMILTKAEILFSRIKRIQFDFEEQIWDANLEMKKQTNGFSFGPDNVLQVLHLLIKGAVRVDPDRVEESDLMKFVPAWSELESPLRSFFYDFLYGEFRITDERIVGYEQAIIPLISYFYYMRTLGKCKFKDFSSRSINNMKKYLIYSQLLEWSLQGYIDNFHRIIKIECEKSANCDFPFEKLRKFVETDTRRSVDLKPENFDNRNQRWFVLKILTPNRPFSFVGNPDERSDPEIDHIFPWNPSSPISDPTKYYGFIETVWNMQPVKGEINNVKRAQLPRDFFKQYPKYLKEYDFLPTCNLDDEVWSEGHVADFIKARRKKIINWVKQNYEVNLVES